MTWSRPTSKWDEGEEEEEEAVEGAPAAGGASILLLLLLEAMAVAPKQRLGLCADRWSELFILATTLTPQQPRQASRHPPSSISTFMAMPDSVCSIIISLRCKKEKKKKKSLINRHTKEKGMVAAMQKPRLQNFWGCCFFNPFVWVLLLCVYKVRRWWWWWCAIYYLLLKALAHRQIGVWFLVDDAKAWGLEICAMGGEGEGDDDDDKYGRASQAGLLLCLILCYSSKSIFGFLLCWGHSIFDERNHSALKTDTHTHTHTPHMVVDHRLCLCCDNGTHPGRRYPYLQVPRMWLSSSASAWVI
jgi:hypothetical protein